jgi:hypothetical protein
MSEKESIDHGYGETVETLFKVFFSEFTLARGDSAGEEGAKERFRNGIVHARHVRELALALLS